VQEILDPEDKAKRCDLLIEMGRGRVYTYEIPHIQHILDNEAPMALSLAEELGDEERACQACNLAVVTLMLSGGAVVFATAEASKWVQAYDRYASPGTVHRAWVDFGIGFTRFVAGDAAGGVHLLHESALLAHKLGDERAFATVGSAYLFFCPSVVDLVEEGRQIAASLQDTWDEAEPSIAGSARLFVGGFLLGVGDRKKAEEIHRELLESQRFSRLPGWQYLGGAIRALYQVMDGQLEEAAESRDDVARFGAEPGAPLMAGICAGWSVFRLTGYLGRHPEELRGRDQPRQTIGLPLMLLAGEAYCLACAGQTEEAGSIIDKIVDQYVAEPQGVMGFFPSGVLLLEAAVLVGHTRAAESLLGLLGNTPYRTTGLHNPTCVARSLGGAAALLGRHEEARKHYQEAIKVCTDMPFRPELALTRLQLAELILDHYPDEKKEAVEHLAFCIPEFRDMKMKPWLERALKHKEILKA
jgi:tetratricopeptide (TPR) repeat protein